MDSLSATILASLHSLFEGSLLEQALGIMTKLALGDHVEVVGGRNRGHIGSIVKVQKGFVSVEGKSAVHRVRVKSVFLLKKSQIRHDVKMSHVPVSAINAYISNYTDQRRCNMLTIGEWRALGDMVARHVFETTEV